MMSAINNIGFAAAAALSLLASSCAEGEKADHVAEYVSLRSQVTECDTLGFALTVCRLRNSERSTDRQRQEAATDADILSAWYFAQQGTRDSALLYANRAITSLRDARFSSDSEWQELMADMEFVKGAAHYTAGETDSCHSHLSQSLNWARRTNYTHRIVKIAGLEANLRRNIGDWHGALSQIRRAEAVMDTTTEAAIAPPCRMASLTDCAGVSIDICDVNTSDRLLIKASAIYDKATDRSKVLYLRQLVRLRFFLGQYSQVETAAKRMEELGERIGTHHYDADANAFKALSHCRMGEADEAERICPMVDRASLSREGGLIYTLLRSEMSIRRRDYRTAHALLYDSVPAWTSLTPYEHTLINESRQNLWVAQGLYEEAYDILRKQRQAALELHNDVFAFSNRGRETHLQNRAAKANSAARHGMSASGIALHIACVIILLGLAFVAAVWHERRTSRSILRKTKRLQDALVQKVAELRQQAEALKVTNDRITESVTYAQHIQQSIVPSSEQLNGYPISGAFVFLSPLDVVSGDFLWFSRKGDKLIVCCADCTGHGVPGAFLSMIAATILNSTCNHISEEEMDAGRLLESLDSSLIENLAHNRVDGQPLKDGLDAALAVLDLKSHVLQTAAARRPVIVIRDGELTTLRGTKRSIGDLDPWLRQRQFETNNIQLAPGDLFYLYTDGYSDQFGGPSGEKMKNSRIERFLYAVHDESMDEQNLTIQEFFMQWKGDYPQTDDVLFVGIRV